MTKLLLSDGYIEENTSGIIYIGETANQCGHIIRRNNITLKEFKRAFIEVLKEKTKELTK